MQIIPPRWRTRIFPLIADIEQAHTALLEHATSENLETLTLNYRGSCERFLDFITRHFLSPRGFDDFLRSEIRQELRACSITDHMMDIWPTWIDHGTNAETKAEHLVDLFLDTYCRFMEDIAKQQGIVGTIRREGVYPHM